MKKFPLRIRHQYQKAFTLVEMAVVLIIIGLVISGLLVSLTAQVEQRNFNETRASIENVKEALLGYAMANGRFPCPAVAPTGVVTAVESPVNAATTGVACTNPLNGYVPGVTLGLSPKDTGGYVLDGWNNPIRYAISNVSDGTYFIFTNSTGMKNASAGAGTTYIAAQTLLTACSTGTGIAVVGTVGSCSGTSTRLTQAAVLMVYSTGKNTCTGGGVGTDEAANLNADTAFVSHVPSAVGVTNGEFDDIVEWISANNVFAKLIQVNQLP